MTRIGYVRTQIVHRLITLRSKAPSTFGRRTLGTPMTGTPWQRLSDLDACRVTRIPRRPGNAAPDGQPRADRDAGRPQRVAALISAYHAGIGRHTDAGPIALGWVRAVAARAGRGAPGRVGPAGQCPAIPEPRELSLPGRRRNLAGPAAGARGDVIAPGGMAAAMNALPCWTRIGGIADALLAGGSGACPGRSGLPGGVPAGGLGRALRLADPRRSRGPAPRSRTTPPRWPASSG